MPALTSMTVALSLIDTGDRSWLAGDRRAAASAWTQAAVSTDPAMQAMASVRLLLVSGNIGLVRHGPRADAALARCPSASAMCSLARSDYEIVLAMLGLPHDLTMARQHATLAARDTPGRAQARRVLLGDAAATSLSDYPDRGGLGDGLLTHGRWPDGPGTWSLGLGVLGAPGIGAGAAIRLHHPDLRWKAWTLNTTAGASSRGLVIVSGQLESPGRVFIHSDLSFRRQVLDDYRQETVLSLWTLDAAVGPGLRVRQQAAWAGPLLRWDDRTPSHGVQGGWRGQAGPLNATLRAEASLQGHTHHRVSTAVVGTWPLGSGTIASRLAAEESFGSDAPWWRQPVAGGGVHLRHAPANRWQAPGLAAAAAEWRLPIAGPLGLVAFIEGAWVDGLHAGIGAGARLHLPPTPQNTVRLDAAWGREGLTLTAGWGEAF